MPAKLVRFSRRALFPVLGLALTLGAVGLAAPAAHARPKRPADNGVRCVIEHRKVDQNGNVYVEYEFFLPGETYRNPVTGASKLCGPNGVWIGRTLPVVGPLAPTTGVAALP